MGLLKKRYGLVLAFCALFAVNSLPVPSCAQAPDIRPGCDPEFMDAIEARAWVHGQRRITQNQNFILKPDSVIEYSCFDQFVTYLGANPNGRRFSENFPPYPNWENISGITDTSLDTALAEVVSGPLNAYVQLPFAHSFLAGRTVAPAPPPPAAGQYTCNTMSQVWKLARCFNFVENRTGEYVLGDDDFYDFPWYAGNEPRRIPTQFQTCTTPTTINAAVTETYRGQGQDGQHGTEWEGFVIATELNPNTGNTFNNGGFYEEDPIPTQVILDFVLPGDCGEAAMVPTGVMVVIPGHASWQENVCSKPSCSYNGSECVQ